MQVIKRSRGSSKFYINSRDRRLGAPRRLAPRHPKPNLCNQIFRGNIPLEFTHSPFFPSLSPVRENLAGSRCNLVQHPEPYRWLGYPTKLMTFLPLKIKNNKTYFPIDIFFFFVFQYEWFHFSNGPGWSTRKIKTVRTIFFSPWWNFTLSPLEF